MPVKKYEPKKEPPIEAILLTEDNAQEVARFCGGVVVKGEGVNVPNLFQVNNYFAAVYGEYVYRNPETGAFESMLRDEFERKYDEVKSQSFLHDHKPGMRSAGQIERVVNPYKSEPYVSPYDADQ